MCTNITLISFPAFFAGLWLYFNNNIKYIYYVIIYIHIRDQPFSFLILVMYSEGSMLNLFLNALVK